MRIIVVGKREADQSAERLAKDEQCAHNKEKEADVPAQDFAMLAS